MRENTSQCCNDLLTRPDVRTQPETANKDSRLAVLTWHSPYWEITVYETWFVRSENKKCERRTKCAKRFATTCRLRSCARNPNAARNAGISRFFRGKLIRACLIGLSFHAIHRKRANYFDYFVIVARLSPSRALAPPGRGVSRFIVVAFSQVQLYRQRVNVVFFFSPCPEFIISGYPPSSAVINVDNLLISGLCDTSSDILFN